MLLYTTINDALHVCYQHNILYSVNVIWHMWNTRSATINQQSVTSVDHNDNIWCNTSRCNSRIKDVYMSAQLLSFFTISIQCVLYCVWFDSLYCTYSPSQPSSSYRQLLRCYCSASWIYDASSQRKGGQAHRCWMLLTVRICSMHLVVQCKHGQSCDEISIIIHYRPRFWQSCIITYDSKYVRTIYYVQHIHSRSPLVSMKIKQNVLLASIMICFVLHYIDWS